jgi:hypothetical protein
VSLLNILGRNVKFVSWYVVVTGTELFTSTRTYSFGLLPSRMLPPSSYFTSREMASRKKVLRSFSP